MTSHGAVNRSDSDLSVSSPVSLSLSLSFSISHSLSPLSLSLLLIPATSLIGRIDSLIDSNAVINAGAPRSLCGIVLQPSTESDVRLHRLITSIMSGTKEEDRKGSSEWREFFWNPRTHEFMGRTATSWGEFGSTR